MGCFFDSSRVNSRNITEINLALFVRKNHFCLIWKTQNVSFKSEKDKVKTIFKCVDNYVCGKHVISVIKYECKPQKVQTQLTNTIVFDLQTYNTDRALLHSVCIYKLNKISGENNRDRTHREYEKHRKDCIVFKGTNCVNDILDQLLEIKGNVKKNNTEIVNCNLYLIAQSGPSFDSYVVLKNLSHWRTITNLNKDGASFVSLKIFNIQVDKDKKVP